jgi:hypothetical protein
MRVRFPLAVVFSIAAAARFGTGLSAQSLADVARQEEARRQTIKDPAKIYTNKDLGSVPSPQSAPPPSAAATPPSPSEVKEGDKPKDDKAKDDKDKAPDGKDKAPVKDQAYWSGRAKELKTQLDRDQSYADAMQSRINGLTADFAARDDPAQRNAINNDRLKAMADLDRLKKAIQDDKKAQDDLSEEARRTGVPAGWLR